MTRTFVDSGVLIAAARTTPGPVQAKALEFLDDPARVFLSSPFVRLEVEPKAHFHRRYAEAAFYRAFFECVAEWVEPSPALIEKAMELGRTYGLAAVDALHVAAALNLGAEEMLTTEGPFKPMFRVPGLRFLTMGR